MKLLENPHQLDLPSPGLVLLAGPPAAGKSTLARTFFMPDEVLSRDALRLKMAGELCAGPFDLEISNVMIKIAAARLESGMSTVVDATHIFSEQRREWYDLAAAYEVPVTVIVLDMPDWICEVRNAQRGPQAVPDQVRQELTNRMSSLWTGLAREPVHQIVRLTTPDAVNAFQPRFTETPTHDLRWVRGPFDLIGDIHGCMPELLSLLQKLGYEQQKDDTWVHPEGRRPVLVGDLTDRGPDSPGVVDLVARMVERRLAFCVMGNHDDKFRRYLAGRKIQIGKALQGTIDQFMALPDSECRLERAKRLLDGMPYHLWFADGKLVVAHAGLREDLHGHDHAEARSFALYGAPTKDKDKHGYPIRPDWASNYRGEAVVVHGHVVVPNVSPVNNVWNVDTGAVFGERLTALRYPEMQVESVPGLQDYWGPREIEDLLPAPRA